jgi:molecular chaperone DnaJ
LKIYVKKDKQFEVEGPDLYMTLDINFIQAILGDEVEFKHFKKTLSLKIPSGAQPGTILRLKEKGIPHFNYGGFGDLYVKINVDIPTKSTSEQKKILGEYAKTLKDKSILNRMKGLFK